MISPEQNLNSISDAERALALSRFRILQPCLEDQVPLTQVAKQQGIPLRTAQRWLMRYRRHGLSGLCRKEHSGRGKCRISAELQQIIEGFALLKPPLSVATVHRRSLRRSPRLSY